MHGCQSASSRASRDGRRAGLLLPPGRSTIPGAPACPAERRRRHSAAIPSRPGEGIMPDLLSPLSLHGLTLRNRIVMPPMWSGQATPDGLVTPDIIEYHRRRAGRRAAASVIVEHAFVHPRGRHSSTQIGVHTDADDRRPEPAGHGHQARGRGRPACRLSHAGSRTSSRVLGMRPLGAVEPCATPTNRTATCPRRSAARDVPGDRAGVRRRGRSRAGRRVPGGRNPRGARLPARPVPVAADQPPRRRVRRRPVENRSRLHLAVLGEVRVARGAPSCPIFVRLGAHDETPGGLELDDACQAASRLAEGGRRPDRRLGRPPGLPRRRARDAAYFVPYAQAIKAAVRVPVMVTGGLGEPDLADRDDPRGMGRPGRQSGAPCSTIRTGRARRSPICRWFDGQADHSL